MKIINSESIPHFDDDDTGHIEPMPIYVTKTTLRTILKENDVELPDLSESNKKSKRQLPKNLVQN